MTPARRPDEVTPVVVPICKCGCNAELLVLVGNLCHEADEHARGLASLHQLVQTAAHPVPYSWTQRLRDEYVRHHTAVGRNVDGFDAYLASKALGDR